MELISNYQPASQYLLSVCCGPDRILGTSHPSALMYKTVQLKYPSYMCWRKVK